MPRILTLLCKQTMPLLDFKEYLFTLLFIADSHFTFPNVFILYATHVLILQEYCFSVYVFRLY
jgi:hypothetical protein